MDRIGRTLVCLALLLLGGHAAGARAETVVYYHTDALGSPVAVTDANGNVIERTQYAPYGETINRPLHDGPGYTGHETDAATGLVYAQQRYYDPVLGRFLSADPVAADARDGGNFNRYWYAEDNSYRYTDPDGRLVCNTFDCITNQQSPRCQSSPACRFAFGGGSRQPQKPNVVAQAADAVRNAFNSVVASSEFVQSSEGIGDSLSLGATKGVRQLSGIGDASPNSAAYKAGYYGSMVPGAGRLLYATGAKSISAVGALIGGEKGAQFANAGRNWLRITFRGFASGYNAYSFSSVAAKYSQDWDAIISASGRTNQQFNEMGIVAGGASATIQATQCVAGQPGC